MKLRRPRSLLSSSPSPRASAPPSPRRARIAVPRALVLALAGALAVGCASSTPQPREARATERTAPAGRSDATGPTGDATTTSAIAPLPGPARAGGAITPQGPTAPPAPATERSADERAGTADPVAAPRPAPPEVPVVTPLEAEERVSDLELTQRIRQRLASDPALSPSARNVKVVVQGGRAELSGTVLDEAEKRRVEAHAEPLVGSGRVVSRITRQR